MGEGVSFETMRPPEEEQPKTEVPEEEVGEEVGEEKPEVTFEERGLEDVEGDVEEKTLTMNERFAKERDDLIRHYTEAYEKFPNASRDPKEIRAAVREYIETKGYFTPTDQERRQYQKNLDLAEGALEKTTKGWRESTVKDVLRAIERLG